MAERVTERLFEINFLISFGVAAIVLGIWVIISFFVPGLSIRTPIFIFFSLVLIVTVLRLLFDTAIRKEDISLGQIVKVLLPMAILIVGMVFFRDILLPPETALMLLEPLNDLQLFILG